MLAKNIIRINGWKNGKRTHVDIETVMNTFELGREGEKVKITAPFIPSDDEICKKGFKNGLDGVTSYNAYNWVGDCRITSKLY